MSKLYGNEQKSDRRTGRTVRGYVLRARDRTAPAHYARAAVGAPRRHGGGRHQDELGIPASTLSHHLEKLKNEGLVKVQREGTFLWYSANTEALQELLGFLYAECCTRNKAIEPQAIVSLCGDV